METNEVVCKIDTNYPEILITSDLQMTAPYGRKQRTKEPLEEDERRERRSWLKTQHSKN